MRVISVSFGIPKLFHEPRRCILHCQRDRCSDIPFCGYFSQITSLCTLWSFREMDDEDGSG